MKVNLNNYIFDVNDILFIEPIEPIDSDKSSFIINFKNSDKQIKIIDYSDFTESMYNHLSMLWSGGFEIKKVRKVLRD